MPPASPTSNRNRSITFPWNDLLELIGECLSSDFSFQMKETLKEIGSAHSTSLCDSAVLYALVRLSKPKIVLETGTFRGVSTAFILRAQRDAGIENGSVVTLDRRSDVTIGCAIPEDLKSSVTMLSGNVRELANDSTVIPPRIDLFYHDSTHRFQYQLWEFHTFWKRLRSGGILASHDVDMNGAFCKFTSGTYCHNGGCTDWPNTTHTVWGRIFKTGFIRKA